MLIKADANEMNYIGMMELGHDDGLHEEIHFRLIGRQLWKRLQTTDQKGSYRAIMKANQFLA